MWTASRSGGRGGERYGQFTQTVDGKQRHLNAHVFSYELHFGPVPEGLEVKHACNHGLCVLPDHLSAGTRLSNVQEAAKDGLYHVPRPTRQKISDAQVEQAIAMVRSGMTQSAVGKAFGVTKVTICRIMRGTLRQHRQPASKRRTA